MNSDLNRKSSPQATRTRLLRAGTALPLLLAAWPALADPIVENSSTDISVDADSASGTPLAVDLATDGGSITVTVDTVTATSVAGARNNVVNLQTADGAIDAAFGTVTVTGEGDVLGVSAESDSGNIDVHVGEMALDGAITSGVQAHSVSGAVTVQGDNVLVAGAGADVDNGFFPEALLAWSDEGAATVIAGTVETTGLYGSATIAIAGTDALVSVENAIAHSAGAVAVRAQGTSSATVEAGTVSMLANGTAVEADSAAGEAIVLVDSIDSLGGGVFGWGSTGVTLAAGSVDAVRFGLSGRSDTGGAVDMAVTDSVTTSGDFSIAVLARTTGDVTIDAANVGVTGPGADPGARADGYRFDQGGIVVLGEGGNGTISINAGTVEVAGEHRYGITVRGNGAIAIAADTVTNASADAVAVVARGGEGDVSITTGTVTTTGASGVGLFADTTSGDIVLDAGTTRVENAGMVGQFTGDAVVATSVSGAISISSENAYSAGYGGSAVVGISGGDVTIDSGIAATTGYGPIGVYARSTGGNAIVSAAETSMSGDDSVGVWVRADAGDATATVGTVSATGVSGDAVHAQANAGMATIATSGDVASAHGYGLRGDGADVSITTAADTVTQGEDYAIIAVASNSATIVNGGTAIATGDLGSAIHVTAPGAVSITSEAVEVTGAGAWPGERSDGSGLRLEQGGIIVEGGAGAIAIDAGMVDIEGEHRYGISARGSGAISIAVDSVNLASPDASAIAARGGEGDVSITTGTIITTGASGTAVVAETTSGAITIDAGTIRVEGEGMAGPFTGEGIYAFSDSGTLTINAVDTFNAAYAGSAIVGISGGDVTIDSGTAETTGDDGVALLGQSSNGTLTFTSDSVTISGANTRAIAAHAFNGVANVAIGDVTALGTNASGVLATGREVNLVVGGRVQSTQIGVNVAAQGGLADVVVNGSIVSIQGPGLVSSAQDGVVAVSEGASVSGATAGVVLIGGLQGGFTQFYNSGTVTGGAGAAVAGIPNANTTVPSFYIQNNGSLIAGGDFAVVTGAGNDTLELTNLSQITGIADLGGGDDRLVLDFNDDAPAGAIGQVVSTINVEGLSVDSGNWRAEGERSVYDFIEIEEGAILTVVENEEGALAVEAGSVELNGVLNLDLSVDETEGDLGETTITGAGSLHLIGTATIELTDATGLQHTGGTFVENGELLLSTVYGGDIATSGDGVFELGAGGDFTGNLVNDGTFVFSRADDYSFLGDFSGSGQLTKQGDSTLTFAGFYAFDGTTSVLGGSVAFTGQLSEDTELDLTEGSVDLSQVDGGMQTIAALQGAGGALQLGQTQLIIQQMGDTVFSGEILGLGTLVKEGDGDLKLNGDGTGFTGTGQVGGGTLSVNGNFSNANFVVDEGGTLGGAGTVGATNVNGGTLAPGNSIDTLTVNGNISFTATSVYEVEVDAAGNSDLLQASGTATLGGARVNVIAENAIYRPQTDYTILTAAGGISGTFGPVTSNLAFLDPTLSYSANAVTLRLVRNNIDFAALGATANQAVVGGLIESFGAGNTLYEETLTLADSNVAVSFGSLTGTIYPAYGAAVIETAEVLRRQTADAAESGEGAFAWATGLYNSIDSGSGEGNIELLGQGAAGGFGFGAGGFSATAGIGKLDQNRGGSQFSDGEVTFAIGRLAWNGMGGVSVNAGAQFGWVEGETRRQTRLGTIDQAVTGTIDGDYFQLFGELAYSMPIGGDFVAEPFAGISHVSLDLDGVTETGAPTALTIAAIDRAVTFADIGLRVSGDAATGVRPFASAAYRHAWGDRASVSSFGFAGLAGTGLVGAVPIAESAAELSAGVVVSRGSIDFEVGYDATISKAFDSHGVSAGFKVRF